MSGNVSLSIAESGSCPIAAIDSHLLAAIDSRSTAAPRWPFVVPSSAGAGLSPVGCFAAGCFAAGRSVVGRPAIDPSPAGCFGCFAVA